MGGKKEREDFEGVVVYLCIYVMYISHMYIYLYTSFMHLVYICMLYVYGLMAL